MYDRISIYPHLHGEGDISCVSLEDLGVVAFQKVVVVATSKTRLGTNETHQVYMAICYGGVERFHTRSAWRPQARNLASCAQSNGVCSQIYLQLIHISI